MADIYALKLNHLSNPIGYYLNKTVFSWKIRNSTGKRQRWARIRVSEDESFTELIYDECHKGFDSLGTNIDLNLKPYTRYYWQVIVNTDADELIYSAVQYFETAKLDEPWTARWIGTKEVNRHPIFSKKIRISKTVKTARLYICGLGLYEAYIKNKQGTVRIGNEYLTPYCNNYDSFLQYQTYDVTDDIEDDCELSVILGNGWYKGRFGFNSKEDKGYYGEEFKLIAELHLTYEDNTKDIIVTDNSWDVTLSNITFSNIYDGEHRNDTLTEERLIIKECTAPNGKLMERLSLPVIVKQEIKPVELLITPKNEKVFDLGQEITGIFKLKIRAPKEQEVHVWTGEVLQDGCFYNDNLRTAKSEYIYISDGIEKEIIPHFTYYGYRYIKIEGIDDLSIDDFTALVLYSDYEEIGNIKTGNELVNKLISNIRWGMRDNFLDIPMDCPQRDERMGWTGDAQAFSPTASYLADTYAFYRKYLYDMYTEQLTHDGMVPETIPSFGPTKTSCVWGDAACILPWNIYLFSGDKSIIEDQYSSMKAWVEYIRRLDGDDHMWRRVFHYGDWLALDRNNGGKAGVYGATDEAYIADIYYAASVDILLNSAKLIGMDDDISEYEELSNRLWSQIKKEYFTETGRCVINTQTGLLLGLKYDLSNDRELIIKALRKLFRDNKGKLNTGFVGTPLLCNVLTENGMEDLAFNLLLNEEYPGWLYEVKLGATTVWERWNSMDEDGKVSSTGMNSFNHYAYGSILEWMFAHVGGLKLNEKQPGGRLMEIAPIINLELKEAEARYDSAAGLYSLKWQLSDDNRLNIKISVPFGAKALVKLPNVPEDFNKQDDPLFTGLVDAGEYEISYPVNLKKDYSTDSGVDELLSNPKIRKFIETMADIDMIPDIAYNMSFKQLVNLFAGGADEEKFKAIDEVLKQF